MLKYEHLDHSLCHKETPIFEDIFFGSLQFRESAEPPQICRDSFIDVFCFFAGGAVHHVRGHHGQDLHVAAVRRPANVPDHARVQEGLQRCHPLKKGHPQHEHLVRHHF